MAGFFDTPLQRMLEQGLDAAALRHRVISNNLANVDTPGYKRQEVAFEDELAQALRQERSGLVGKTSNPRHLPINGVENADVKPKMITVNDEVFRNDKNNVDIDKEMAVLAKNTLWYDALITRTAGRLAGIKNVIREVR
ncbi:flagellar basal body rod protein FlgB [Heliophilum fasciatum]|uniref:Flagellar basal body rod protein FlgB n=1 Tax=Heliophilum fasciatum TaxID=35700 RepID=A0A4R2RKQ0_9FIRM|nr:flagellar basal body rod protein FlgB [Heliophilum fasciatum]MCW2277948.1 flagellar basal-body rod protein FlgB [Heliophilum fasciatum]TCP64482.1 flagellar basal-body rod protein FlgB [Heliophilum fasciatum]